MAARQKIRNINGPIPLTSFFYGSKRAAKKGQIYVSKLHWSISRGMYVSIFLSLYAVLLHIARLFSCTGNLRSYFERFGKVDSVFIPYVS